MPSSSCSLYALLLRLVVILNGPSPVGAKLSLLGIFFGFSSDSSYELTRLKGLWLNLCIVSPCCSKFGSFFFDPSHVLDFVCCFELYPHIFFILLLLEQQFPCRRFPDFNKDESVRSFVGCRLGRAMVCLEYARVLLFP